jgi:plasmanylethanolamine desaturase
MRMRMGLDMSPVLITLLEASATVLAADFVSGVIHWAEDAYIREQTPLLGRWIGRANTLHHHLPREMTRKSWWESNWDLLAAMTLLVLVAGCGGWLTWHVWLFAIIASNANEVHKWSHRTRKENGRIISLMQDLRLLQTPRHHAIHHTNPKEVHYCPLTNALNPLLDGLQFWSALEWLLARTLGLRRQPDSSVPGQGVAPSWIQEMRTGSKDSATPLPVALTHHEVQ